jgi:hypothetical protein
MSPAVAGAALGARGAGLGATTAAFATTTGGFGVGFGVGDAAGFGAGTGAATTTGAGAAVAVGLGDGDGDADGEAVSVTGGEGDTKVTLMGRFSRSGCHRAIITREPAPDSTTAEATIAWVRIPGPRRRRIRLESDEGVGEGL